MRSKKSNKKKYASLPTPSAARSVDLSLLLKLRVSLADPDFYRIQDRSIVYRNHGSETDRVLITFSTEPVAIRLGYPGESLYALFADLTERLISILRADKGAIWWTRNVD